MSTVGVISLGCSKNRVDSERILGCFADAGFTITPNPEEAEVLLVNTCGFITPAKEESINTTLEMAQYKQTGRCKLLVMAGCLSQRYPGELEAETYLLSMNHFRGGNHSVQYWGQSFLFFDVET